jgi:hypothetical protein
MGKTTVGDKAVVTPASETRVSELKELADIPAHEKLYTKDGRILEDDEVVPTEHNARYDVIPDLVRGQD